MKAPRVTETKEGYWTVDSPYDKKFIEGAHQLSARWDQWKRVWVFDPSLREEVFKLVDAVYGTKYFESLLARLKREEDTEVLIQNTYAIPDNKIPLRRCELRELGFLPPERDPKIAN